MATPGWYPDPAGRPGAFRYWDGQGWGADVTDNPPTAAPGGAPSPPAPPPPPAPMPPPAPPAPPADPTVVPGAPPPFQPYGQQPGAQPPPPAQGWAGTPASPGWPGQPPPPYLGDQSGSGTSGGGTGKVVGLVALAVVLLIALGVGAFFVIRSDDDTDTDTASDDSTSQTDPSSGSTSEPTDPTSEPTEELTEEPTEEPAEEPADPFTDPAVPTQQQCAGGAPEQGGTGAVGNQVTGGGLTMPRVPGFSAELDQAVAFTFADGVFAPSKVVESNETAGWVAVYALGGLTKSHGFTSPGEAAGVVLECMTRSQLFYEGFTGATLLDSRATTAGGADAWVMDAEIRIDNPDLKVEGDIAKVIVVDTGDPERYGLFVSVVPIGDQALIGQQQAQEQLLDLG